MDKVDAKTLKIKEQKGSFIQRVSKAMGRRISRLKQQKALLRKHSQKSRRSKSHNKSMGKKRSNKNKKHNKNLKNSNKNLLKSKAINHKHKSNKKQMGFSMDKIYKHDMDKLNKQTKPNHAIKHSKIYNMSHSKKNHNRKSMGKSHRMSKKHQAHNKAAKRGLRRVKAIKHKH